MFKHATVWHSALKKACEAAETGRLRVCITSRAVESRHAHRPPYIELRIDGDRRDRQYQAEDIEIQELLESLPIGRPVWIQAAGGKGAQTLSAWTDAGEPIPQPAPGTAPASAPASAAAGGKAAAPAPRPARSNGTRAEAAPAPARDTIAADTWSALLEAERMVTRFEAQVKRRIRPEEIQLAAAILTQMDGVREVSRRPPTEAPRPGPDT